METGDIPASLASSFNPYVRKELLSERDGNGPEPALF